MTRRRCACRPGCLAWLHRDDITTDTPDGTALAAHVGVQPYPDELTSDDSVEALT